VAIRHRTFALLAASTLAAGALGITSATLVSNASAASKPIFTVMNTSETLPDGVWFRSSPHTADTDRVTGHGVYKNERVQLECYAWGDAVGAYHNRLWYYVLNVTRPVNKGKTNQGYLNAHYINDGKAANQVDAGVPQCGAQSTTVNASYNRTVAVNWVLAHARDPQGNGGLCTWFVSSALWTGGMPKTAGWKPGVASATWVGNFVNYFRGNVSATWTDITPNLKTNAVPQAEAGDIIVYDWNGDHVYDHMSFVDDITSGRYPEVSEMGQFNFKTHPWYYVTHPRSPYVKRGWTWSAMHHEWLQQVYPRMRAYLLHINGGYFTPSY
jgi:outer membrane protein assembly factor BamE (lipoprotein component of BamABCDE complex)